MDDATPRFRLSKMFDAELVHVREMARAGAPAWEDGSDILGVMYIRLQGCCSADEIAAILVELETMRRERGR